MLQEILHASEIMDKLDCGLLPDPRATRDIVDLVAHEREQVDHLRRALYAVAGADLLLAAQFEILPR